MMSSLLFYHKKENPSLASLTVRGGGLERFCSERPGGAAATSESREPVKLCPATSSEGEKSRSRGGGRGCEPPLPPFFLWGELFLLLLVRGEGKYEGGREHPIVLPDALHTAHTYYVRASVPQCSRLCIRSLTARRIPQWTRRESNPQGISVFKTLPPYLAHPVILFRITGRRIRPRADGRPVASS